MGTASRSTCPPTARGAPDLSQISNTPSASKPASYTCLLGHYLS